MKVKLFILTIASFVVISCNTKPKQSSSEPTPVEVAELEVEETLPLITVKTTVTGTGANQETKEEAITYDDAYFEISLNRTTNDAGVHYVATKYLERSTSLDNFKLVILSIADVNNEVVQFSSSTEFLNYMAEREYDLVEKTDFELRSDYVFKRKE